MTLDEWKAKRLLAKWSVFYYEYVVPLAKLSRLLRQATTTTATNKHALDLAGQYVRGMRRAFGVEFMHSKTIVHRLYHLLTQLEGEISSFLLCVHWVVL